MVYGTVAITIDAFRNRSGAYATGSRL